MFKTIWQWLVYSSTDPSKVAMTVKGFLIGIIPFVMIATNFTHVNIGDQQMLTDLVDAIANGVQYTLGLVSVVMFVYGFVRKVWLTIAGENKVLH